MMFTKRRKNPAAIVMMMIKYKFVTYLKSSLRVSGDESSRSR